MELPTRRPPGLALFSIRNRSKFVRSAAGLSNFIKSNLFNLYLRICDKHTHNTALPCFCLCAARNYQSNMKGTDGLFMRERMWPATFVGGALPVAFCIYYDRDTHPPQQPLKHRQSWCERNKLNVQLSSAHLQRAVINQPPTPFVICVSPETLSTINIYIRMRCVGVP